MEAKLARKGLDAADDDELGYDTEGSKLEDEVTDADSGTTGLSSWLLFLLFVLIVSVTRISTDEDLDLSCLGEALSSFVMLGE